MLQFSTRDNSHKAEAEGADDPFSMPLKFPVDMPVSRRMSVCVSFNSNLLFFILFPISILSIEPPILTIISKKEYHRRKSFNIGVFLLTISNIRDIILLAKQIYQKHYNTNTSRKHLKSSPRSWKAPRSEGESDLIGKKRKGE